MDKDTKKCTKGYRCTNDADYRKHSCPYQAEIYDNNDENYCDCCSDCRYECAMDV